MSAARGVGTLSIIRIEPATVNQELIASAHVGQVGRWVNAAVASGRTWGGGPEDWNLLRIKQTPTISFGCLTLWEAKVTLVNFH